MNNNIASNDSCSGCGLCRFICPYSAIDMRDDGKGFARPTVDADRCTACGLCLKVCHEHTDMRLNPIQKCYKAYSLDKDTIMKSSSGGVFSEIAKTVLDQDGVVFGAAFDPEWNLCHQVATNWMELAPLRTSKYIESNVATAYGPLKKHLTERPVLFVGTPCQCAAVKGWIKNDKNLHLCDFVCHGVASPGLFHKMLNKVRPQLGTIESICFRHKITGNDSYFQIKGANGDIRIPNYKFGFPYAFASGLTLADDCLHCCYASEKRCSDLTLGDYIGDKVDYGCSTICVNTQKGEDLLHRSSVSLEKADLEEVKRRSWHLSRPVTANPDRKRFFKDYATKSYDYLESKWFSPPSIWKLRIRRIISILKRVFPHDC